MSRTAPSSAETGSVRPVELHRMYTERPILTLSGSIHYGPDGDEADDMNESDSSGSGWNHSAELSSDDSSDREMFIDTDSSAMDSEDEIDVDKLQSMKNRSEMFDLGDDIEVDIRLPGAVPWTVAHLEKDDDMLFDATSLASDTLDVATDLRGERFRKYEAEEMLNMPDIDVDFELHQNFPRMRANAENLSTKYMFDSS